MQETIVATFKLQGKIKDIEKVKAHIVDLAAADEVVDLVISRDYEVWEEDEKE